MERSPLHLLNSSLCAVPSHTLVMDVLLCLNYKKCLKKVGFPCVSCRKIQPALWGIGRGWDAQKWLIMRNKGSHPRAASIASGKKKVQSPSFWGFHRDGLDTAYKVPHTMLSPGPKPWSTHLANPNPMVLVSIPCLVCSKERHFFSYCKW